MNIELTIESDTHCKVLGTDEARGVLYKFSQIANKIQKANQEAETRQQARSNR